MRVSLLAALVLVTGCGFHFSLGENPHGRPLVLHRVIDLSEQGLGRPLERYLPAALSAEGLSAGTGAPIELIVEVLPWSERSHYGVSSAGTIPYGEQFTAEVRTRVLGRVIRAKASVTVTPSSSGEARLQNISRAEELLAERLARALARSLR